MNKLKIIIMLAAFFLLAGCQTRWAKEEADKREDRKMFDAIYQLQAAGLKGEYDLYAKTEYAKTYNVSGYIENSRSKEAKKEEQDKLAAEKEEGEVKVYYPSLRADVRACVLQGGSIDNYRYDPSTCFEQLPYEKRTLLAIKGTGNIIPAHRKMEVIGPLLKEIKEVHDEKNVREFTEVITRARARERQQAEAQKAAAKRAYDSSIQSLVE